jgi:hypothetical protein
VINGWICKMSELERDIITDIEISISPIRTSFIIAEKKPSYRDLEKSYGMPKSTIQDIAKKENWEAQRAKYHRSIIGASEKKVMTKVASERRKKLEKINTVFHKGIDRLLELIDGDKYVVSVRDLNILVRLTEFLEGNPEEIKEKRFVLDKPLQEYSIEELMAMQNQIIEGTATIVEEENEEEYVDYDIIEDDDESEDSSNS